MASAFEVANWFIERFEKDNQCLTQLQLHKLAFIAHGWHLAFLDSPLIKGEPFRAWKYGPVVPELYREFREFGGRQIDRKALLVDASLNLYPPTLTGGNLTEQVLEFAYKNYGHLSGPELINVTHREGSPWAVATKNGTEVETAVPLKDEEIKIYYRDLRAKSSAGK